MSSARQMLSVVSLLEAENASYIVHIIAAADLLLGV